MSSVVNDDLFVAGTLSARYMSCPAGSVVSASITGPVDASKLERAKTITYSQPSGADNADATIVVGRIHGTTGTIKTIKAANAVTALNSDTTTVDVKLNGTSLLTGVISIAAADTTTVKSGTLASSALAVGDILSVVINATGTDPGEGIAVFIEFDEDYA